MEKRVSKILLLLLISLFYKTMPTVACGWYESGDMYRIAMFRAEMKGMSGFRPFYYSAKYLNDFFPDPEKNDQYRNNLEWQKKLGKNVLISDINTIVYNTQANDIINAYEQKQLGEVFEGNTFIQSLLKKENTQVLKYFVFAKQNEFYNFLIADPWSDSYNEPSDKKTEIELEIIKTGEKNLLLTKDNFLKQRYAFHLCRIYYQVGRYDDSIEAFDNNFDNDDKSVLYYWSLLHKALSLDNLGKDLEANLMYAQVFASCDDKKVRAYTCFNNSPKVLKQTLDRASTKNDKIAVLALSCFKNPGPALHTLVDIFSLSPNSEFLAPLIMREINKLEDWLITPKLTGFSPSMAYYNEMQKAISENEKKDSLYLIDFKNFLTNAFENSKGEFRSYLAISLAHLNLINDSPEDAATYLNEIASNAGANILFQKNIDHLLYNIYSKDITQQSVMEEIAETLIAIDQKKEQNTSLQKLLYSTCLQLSAAYKKKGAIAVAGLYFTKGYLYKTDDYGEAAYEHLSKSSYWALGFFDRYAQVKDIDQLVEIIKTAKTNKWSMYLCSQVVGKTDELLNLKGTLAFRTDDLETSLQAFSQINESYWTENYESQNYLNEDPFLPKTWPHKRSFNYQFSKKEFIQKLINLKKEATNNSSKAAENYLLLGHAYYNCSYWGNSWLMYSYEWSSSGRNNYSYWGYIFGDFPEIPMFDQYFTCDKAVAYYQKALNATDDIEIKAAAQYMLHNCDLHEYLFKERDKDWDAPKEKFQSKYLDELYEQYSNTETFKKVRCSLMDDYMEAKNK